MKGFTLIELLAVLVILGLIIGIGAIILIKYFAYNFFYYVKNSTLSYSFLLYN